jgi:hypothetical protein
VKSLIRFCLLVTVKVLARIFYRLEATFVEPVPKDPFRNVRIALLLNHTSLFEPLFLGPVPLHALWDIARKGAFPGADVTMNRPLAGLFYKWIAPDAITITRKRDATWDNFVATVQKDSLILIAPEGRMMRRGGLDKEGKPMTVRGGVADLFQFIDEGRMIIAYSGGLHHVHAPGDKFPKFFKRLRIRFEVLEIADYKRSLGIFHEHKDFKLAVIRDLEARKLKRVP